MRRRSGSLLAIVAGSPLAGHSALAQCITPHAELKPIAFKGGAAPGIPGRVLDGFFGGTSAGSYTFFGGRLDPTLGLHDLGVWRVGPDASTELFVQTGDAVPGAPVGTVVGKVFNPTPTIVSAMGEDVYLRTALDGPSITPENQFSIVRVTPNALTLVVQEGMQAPGFFPGVTFDAIGELRATHDGSGVVFTAVLKGPGVYPDTAASVWRSGPGGLQLLVQAGEVLPGKALPVYWFDELLASSTGAALVWGPIRPDPFPGTITDWGAWIAGAGAPEFQLGIGSPLPGLSAGATVGIVLGYPSLGLGNLNAWSLIAQGPGLTPNDNRFAITRSAGVTTKIMRSGDPAPGLGAGTKLANFATPIVRDADLLLVFAELTGAGVGNNNRDACWLITPSGQELVWRSGNAVPGFPGWTFLPATPNSGEPVCFLNGKGDVAIKVKIKDGTGQEIEGIMARHAKAGLRPVVLSGQILEIAPGDPREVSGGYFLDGGEIRGAGTDGRPVSLGPEGQFIALVHFTDQTYGIYHATLGEPECIADFDADGSLTIDDFVAFQTTFAVSMPAADVDCDGSLSISDFIVFQTLFALGCP